MRVTNFRLGIPAKIAGVSLTPIVILMISMGVILSTIQGSIRDIHRITQVDESLMMNTEQMTRELYHWDDDLDGAFIALKYRDDQNMRNQLAAAAVAKSQVYSAFDQAIAAGLPANFTRELRADFGAYSAFAKAYVHAIQAQNASAAVKVTLMKSESVYDQTANDLTAISNHYNQAFRSKMALFSNSMTNLRSMYLLTIVLGGLAAIGISAFMSRSLVVRVKSLAQNIQRVANGERELTGAFSSLNDEIGDAEVALINTVFALKTAEQKAKQQLEFHRTLLKASPLPVFVVDVQNRLLDINDVFADFFGLSIRETFHRDVYDVLSTYLPPSFGQNEFFERMSRKSRVFEIQLTNVMKQSRNVIVFKSGFRDENGAIAGYIALLMDITEQKVAERTIQEHNSRMRTELELAGNLQRAFLPREFPNIRGVEMTSKYIPSSYLAGDMYNVVALDEKHLAFYILDVMGHGVSAALNAIAINYFIRPVGHKDDLEEDFLRLFHPTDVLHHVNRKFGDFFLTETYFTLFYAIIDLSTLEMAYARGGHPAPVLMHSNGETEFLNEGDMPLGLMKDVKYDLHHAQLRRGDKLILYSDGLVEVANKKNEFFNAKGLSDVMAMHKDLKIADLVEKILTTVEAYSLGQPFHDDVTVFGLALQE